MFFFVAFLILGMYCIHLDRRIVKLEQQPKLKNKGNLVDITV